MKHSFLKAILFCLLTILTSLSSCKKDEDKQPELPPETNTGTNTAGFVVNDKIVVLPSNSISSVPGNGTIYGLYAQFGPEFNNDGNDYFTLIIENVGAAQSYGIYLRMPNMTSGRGTYSLGQSNGETYYDGPNHPQIILITGGKNAQTKWYYSSENSGSIEFTRVDNANYYYAGTFECTLYNKDNPNETINISKGRFDINARTLNK